MCLVAKLRCGSMPLKKISFAGTTVFVVALNSVTWAGEFMLTNGTTIRSKWLNKNDRAAGFYLISTELGGSLRCGVARTNCMSRQKRTSTVSLNSIRSTHRLGSFPVMVRSKVDRSRGSTSKVKATLMIVGCGGCQKISSSRKGDEDSNRPAMIGTPIGSYGDHSCVATNGTKHSRTFDASGSACVGRHW